MVSKKDKRNIIIVISLISLVYFFMQWNTLSIIFSPGIGAIHTTKTTLIEETTKEATYSLAFESYPIPSSAGGLCNSINELNLDFYFISDEDNPAILVENLNLNNNVKAQSVRLDGIQAGHLMCSDISQPRTVEIKEVNADCKPIPYYRYSNEPTLIKIECSVKANILAIDPEGREGNNVGAFYGGTGGEVIVTFLKEGIECTGNVPCSSGFKCVNDKCVEDTIDGGVIIPDQCTDTVNQCGGSCPDCVEPPKNNIWIIILGSSAIIGGLGYLYTKTKKKR